MDAHREDRIARATLGWLFEPGDRQLGTLLDSCGPREALTALRRTDAPAGVRADLWHRYGSDVWSRAAEAIQFAEHCGVRVLIPADGDWPRGLHGRRAPVCLWARGPAPVPQPQDTVTIVGTRVSTAYGNEVAADLACALGRQGRTVMSTLNVGIDDAALGAALANDGVTVAVLGGGLDQMSVHARHRWRPLIENGLLLSVWPLGTPPSPDRVQARGRLLAALSAGTVLVEASLHCPALQILRYALDQGRVGMVVPGPVTSGLSTVPHQLLRTDPRVRLVTNAADVIADLRAHLAPDATEEGTRR